jgi:hypothetical protein
MTPTSADVRPDTRRYVITFVVQLVLMGMAIFVSRLEIGAVAREVLVMSVATVSAVTVAAGLMGIRRDGLIVVSLVLFTVFFLAGLLFWPAWDVYER